MQHMCRILIFWGSMNFRIAPSNLMKLCSIMINSIFMQGQINMLCLFNFTSILHQFMLELIPAMKIVIFICCYCTLYTDPPYKQDHFAHLASDFSSSRTCAAGGSLVPAKSDHNFVQYHDCYYFCAMYEIHVPYRTGLYLYLLIYP